MSVINKVLLDLDKRTVGAGDAALPGEVRAVVRRSGGHEALWSILSVLVLAGIGWVGWVWYQVQPRPLATEVALQAEEARARRKAAPTPPAPTSPAVEVAAAAPKPAEAPAMAPAPAPAKPAEAAPPKPAPEMLRLASSIETPIPPAAKKAAAAPALAPRQAAPAPEKTRVERRDREQSTAVRAEGEFRRGVDLLKRGRATEAEGAFNLALELDANHHAARQALVALAFERGQLESARKLLQDGLAIDPAQPDFAVALARIYVERANPVAALSALDVSTPYASNYAEFHVLRGTILQRLGRHAEAADAYRVGLAVQSSNPQAWMGLGISLEALQQRAAASDAFKNALAAGPVSAELRTFAEQRIRALR